MRAGDNTHVRDDRYWRRCFWFGLFAVTVLRIGFLHCFPYDLSPDEAYYWDWSRHLSWGYYSKPPMVAWVMGLFSYLTGSSAFSVRLPAAIFSSMTLACLYLAGSRMFDTKTGLFSSFVFLGTIGSAVASMIMTIDAPLLFFWSASMALVWRAWQGVLEQERWNWCWWAVAGAAAGFGLLSKQTMVGLSLGVMLFFLMTSSRGRRFLLTPLPWVYVAMQVIMILPVLFWNYHHDWITFQHTAHHFESSSRGVVPNLKTFFELIGTQAGIVTPVTFLLCILVPVCLLWRFFRNMFTGESGSGQLQNEKLALLLAIGILPLVAVFALSLRQRVNANWPAPFYLSLSILVSAWALNKTGCGPGLDKLRRLFLPGIGLGLFLVMLLYMLPVVMGGLNLAGSKLDPTIRLRGWHELGMEAGHVLDGFPDPRRTFIVARRRQTVSELAFYMPGQPRVYRWNGMQRDIGSQYELWPGPVDKVGWDALIIYEKDKILERDLVSCFKGVEFIRQIDIPLDHGVNRSFMVYRGVEMDHWADR